MAVLLASLAPFAHRWILKRVTQIRLRCCGQCGAVGAETKPHGGEHRVGNAEFTEQPVAATAVSLQAVRPELIDAGNIGLKWRRGGNAARGGAYRTSALQVCQRAPAPALPSEGLLDLVKVVSRGREVVRS